MFECRRFRVEMWQCQSGNYHVTVEPIEYLGKDEFKKWIRLCKKNFMKLVNRKPWQFESVYSTHADAVVLAKHMTGQLGELCFFDRTKGQVQIVTPKEA